MAERVSPNAGPDRPSELFRRDVGQRNPKQLVAVVDWKRRRDHDPGVDHIEAGPGPIDPSPLEVRDPIERGLGNRCVVDGFLNWHEVRRSNWLYVKYRQSQEEDQRERQQVGEARLVIPAPKCNVRAPPTF
jgi:hypothetical protein